jgi:hypothetical protein
MGTGVGGPQNGALHGHGVLGYHVRFFAYCTTLHCMSNVLLEPDRHDSPIELSSICSHKLGSVTR